MGKGIAPQLGAGLARLRITHGMTQRQLAEAADVSPLTVSKAEAGHTLAPVTIDALAAVLGEAVFDVTHVNEGVREVLAGADTVRPVLAARIERGWSRAEASRRLCIDQKTLTRLESGERVKPGTALKVAQFYGLDVFDLIPDPTKEDNGAPVAA